jgi:hypothetical protein
MDCRLLQDKADVALKRLFKFYQQVEAGKAQEDKKSG